MLVPSGRMFRNPGDYACAQATFVLLSILFAGMTAVATIGYWRRLHAPDRTTMDHVAMATPLSVYVCEDSEEVRDEDSMIPYFEVAWLPATKSAYGEQRLLDGANCTLVDDASNLRCASFRVPGGLPGRLPNVMAGTFLLRPSQQPPSSRQGGDFGKHVLKGTLVKVSMAHDVNSPVARQNEIFKSAWLPLAANVSRKFAINGKRTRWTYTDSIGGRFGATADDTFYFDVQDVDVSTESGGVYEHEGVSYPWQLIITCMNPVVIHLHDVNDMMQNTLTLFAQVVSFLALFKIMLILFVADGMPRQFRFHIPCLGLGADAKAEQEPLLSNA